MRPLRVAPGVGFSRWLATVLPLVLGTACENIHEYAGAWEGGVAPDPVLRQGFAPGARIRVTIGTVTRTDLEMTVTLPGSTTPLSFQAIHGAQGDALANLRIDGDPLRTMLGYLNPTGGDGFLAVVSIFPDERIDLRVIRGANEIYGVFKLSRAR